MTSDEQKRRDVIRAVGGLAVAGSLAGCLSTGGESPTETGDPETDSATHTGEGTATTGSGDFAYGDWLPVPEAFDAERYSFGVLRPAALAANADALGSSYYDDLVPGGALTDATGVDPSEVRTLAGFHAGMVMAAPFDAEAVATSLQEAGFETGGTHRDFDLWTGEESSSYPGQTVAVGDGVLVAGRATPRTTVMEATTAVIDAGVDAGKRYPDASRAASTLVDRLQAGEMRVGIPREPREETRPERAQFAGNTAIGYRAMVGGTDTGVRLVFVFESESAVDVEAVRTWTETSDSQVMEYLQNVEVGQDGRVVTVDGTLPTGDVGPSGLGAYFGSRGEEVETNVQAGASVQVDDEANRVKVLWTSNQNAEYLTVEFDPEGGSTTTKTLQQVGDTVTYEGSDGETVTATVKGHAGDQSVVIYKQTVRL